MRLQIERQGRNDLVYLSLRTLQPIELVAELARGTEDRRDWSEIDRAAVEPKQIEANRLQCGDAVRELAFRSVARGNHVSWR